jgi:hypothetical protein
MHPVLTILVHPGSLGGSYETAHEYHPDWKEFARAQRDLIADTFSKAPSPKVVVLGSFLDTEVKRYPLLEQAVKSATSTFYAEPEEGALQQAAKAIAAQHPNTPMLVTGAWCDKPDGCAWVIFDTLKSLGVKVILDNEGAYESDINELQSDSEDED